MLTGLNSIPLTLTWLDSEGETKGVSAPAEIWIGQIVLALPTDIQTAVMDAVVVEVERFNVLAAEAEEETENGDDE